MLGPAGSGIHILAPDCGSGMTHPREVKIAFIITHKEIM